MPKYRVILTRDITESTVIEIEAKNQEAACDGAYDVLYNMSDSVWEIDDGCETDPPYVTGVEEV